MLRLNEQIPIEQKIQRLNELVQKEVFWNT